MKPWKKSKKIDFTENGTKKFDSFKRLKKDDRLVSFIKYSNTEKLLSYFVDGYCLLFIVWEIYLLNQNGAFLTNRID
jgi:hypothetical protein